MILVKTVEKYLQLFYMFTDELKKTKETSYGIRNKKKKRRTTSSEYSNTNGKSTKNFGRAWQILVVKEMGSLSESINKEKFVLKIIFQIIYVEWSSKML